MHYFIQHTAHDPEDGVAYFGPFDNDDPEDYANDAYADLLAGFGEVEVVDEVAPDTYVNPMSYWVAQRARAATGGA